MKRGAAVAAVSLAVLLVATMATPALAAVAPPGDASPQVNGSDVSGSGPFDVEDLRRGGVHPGGGAPTSTRNLGDPVMGGVMVQHQEISPIQNSYSQLEPETTLQNDRVRLRGTTYGEAVGDYELVIVYWNEKTERVNGSVVTYAANQEVQRAEFSTDPGYWTRNVELFSHYDGAKQATMWVEQDGERVEGARWQFTHKSNPLTAAPGFEVNSKADLFGWGAVVFLLPAIPGLFIGRRGARHFLDRTVVGPRKGTTWWLLVIGFMLFASVSVATWQTAAFLARAPYVLAVLFTLLSFTAFLGYHDQDVETAEFNQKNLTDVTDVNGEDTKSARDEKILLRDIVRKDNKIYLPAKGIRPFLARYWANPAQVDESDLSTLNNTSGDVSKKFEIDPGADETLVHTPAHLSFSPTLILDDNGPDPLAGVDDPSTLHELQARVGHVLGRINWSFVLFGGGGALAVYLGLTALTGAKLIAGMLAMLPIAIMGYEARAGDLKVQMAPYHFSDARAILAQERARYREASTFEDLHKMIANLDLEVIEQTQETTEAVRGQLRDKLTEMFQVPEIDSDGGSDDDDGGPGVFEMDDPVDPDNRSPGVSDD